MPDSHASEKRIRAAQRRTQALELRLAGKSFRQIGEAMGFSEARAHHVVTLELERLNLRRAEKAEAVLRLEVERLDVLLAGIWETAKKGDGAAIDRVLSIMARRAKLMGLDAPDRKDLWFSGPGAGAGPRPEEMTDDQLAIVAAGGSGAGTPAPPAGPAST